MAGGMHGGRACMVGGHAWQEKRQLQWAIRILLECILVDSMYLQKKLFELSDRLKRWARFMGGDWQGVLVQKNDDVLFAGQLITFIGCVQN